MARSTKTTAAVAEPKATARKAPARAKPASAASAAVPPAPAKAKAGKTAVQATPAKAGKTAVQATPAKAVPAPAVAIPARLPPPSKGELRAHIEKLEAANAALKVKSRESNRTAKAANRRIDELEAEVARLQEQAVQPVAAPPAEKVVRRGRPPRSREINPGDAVPPGIAVLDPEPLDAEAEAARDALEENLSDK